MPPSPCQESVVVNHYERLKVSPDAPPEVIRAAYRALAAKMHPDRKVGDSGPGDQQHEDMAALNASYLVLMDSKARTEYDQLLAQQTRQAIEASQTPTASRWARRKARPDAPPMGPSGDHLADAGVSIDGTDTRVDVDWLSANPPMLMPWYRQPNVMVGLLVGGSLLLGGLIWWGVQQAEHMQFDHGISTSSSEQGGYDRNTPVAPSPQAAAAIMAGQGAPGASAPPLSKDRLAHMSDAELLAAVPQLLDGSAAATATQAEASDGRALNPGVDPQQVGVAAAGPHLLDGQPLLLKLAPLQLQQQAGHKQP